MYYHTVVLHLFRPFLKVDLTNSRLSPREICTSCAEYTASLLSTYRQTYGLRRVTVLMAHITLSSSIIHLLNLPNPSASRNLSLSISSLRELSTAHAFATRCVHIITSLATQWNISLPVEISLRNTGAGKSLRVESAFDLPQPQSSPRAESYPSQVSDHAQPQDQANVRNIATETPMAEVRTSPRPSTTSSTQADLFWSPFPDQSLPLQAHHTGGPMDISAMLDVPNEWDQLNRDGFRVASTNESMLAPLTYNHVGNANSPWTQP